MASMSITRKEAYKILQLPPEVDQDSIRTSYKRLAPKWLPEKHPNSRDALDNFKKITLAYKCLCSSSESCTITLEETFDIYMATFHPNSHPVVKAKNPWSDSESDYVTSSEDDEDIASHLINDKLLSVFGKGSFKAQNRKDIYTDTDDDDDDDGDDDDEEEDDDEFNTLTLEQREQVANELISEEEKKKKKLEKRRAKKKQRREKKKLEKLASEEVKSNEQNLEKKNGSNGTSTNDHTEQSKKRNEANNNSRLKEKAKPEEEQSQTNGQNNDPDFILSRKYAVEGNTLASRGFFTEAIVCFTKAIELNSAECRYFGNRSYCYEKVDEYEKALEDADESLRLAPDWPKGHYRRGIALSCMKQYTKAEESFREVLRLDSKCDDATKELHKVQVIQLMDMGFTNSQAEQAASKCDSLQQALDLLLSGFEKFSLGNVENSEDARMGFSARVQSTVQTTNPVNNGGVVNSTAVNGLKNGQNKNDIKLSEPASGDNGFVVKTTSGKNKQKKAAALLPIPQHHYEEAQRNIELNQQRTSAEHVKMNPRNPLGLKSIWVGNVLPDVPQDEFQNMFTQFGKLQGIRFMPDKFCAFVNFVDKEAAGNAMHHLQGKECHGQRLLIKFPDHPTETNGKPEKIEPASSAVKPLRSVKEASIKTVPLQAAVQVPSKIDKMNGGKVTGPVNGNECYFWRTTGCQFSDNCRFLHIPDHRGVDKKPWHKSK